MGSSNSDAVKELKLAAKWSIDSSEKKKAISQLLQYGDEARPAFEEILGITAYNDVKQACVEALKSLGRKQKDRPVNRISGSKRTTKRKKQSKRKRAK